MRKYGTPEAFRSNLNYSRCSQSASHGKLTWKSKVGSSSAPNLTWRKKSPKSVESQERNNSPIRNIDASKEGGPGVDPEEIHFDVQREANVRPQPKSVESQETNNSPNRNIDASKESAPVVDPEEIHFDVQRDANVRPLPKSVESQERNNSPDRNIDASKESGPGVDPEEIHFDVQIDANVRPLPKSVESQERNNSPHRNIDASKEIRPGVDPEAIHFEFQRDANASSLNREAGQLSVSTDNWRAKSPRSAESQEMQTSPKRTFGTRRESDHSVEVEESFFDICSSKTHGLVKLCRPLHVLNRERKKEFERFQTATDNQYLRPGMILLKYFLTHRDQVKIVNKCRELGKSCGGFYRPGYGDGAKLRLQMMCLGKDWNPESRLYGKCRAFDGAEAPEIPEEIKKLVDGALNTSHEFLSTVKAKSVDEIPLMTPDICIVNFYNNNGRLGLHQDKDESEDSLKDGLPVVSFSIGDSAEFLYSDVRNADKAENIILESGDVLIFGGKSRHIFHGVSCILPGTAPEILISETNLRPGRLNLTFRQY